MNLTTSLLGGANLDRDAIRADNGDLFLGYGQTDALGF
jgi:hypothetical protein